MMSYSSMYDFFFCLPPPPPSTSDFNVLKQIEQTGLSTFRRHSSDSTEEAASAAEKTNRVYKVMFVKLTTKHKT